MFQRIIDDVKETARGAVRLSSLAAAAAFALLITTVFLCAAAFIFVLQRYGAVEACLAGAAVFFVVTAIAAGCYMSYKNQMKLRAERAARNAARSMLADPAMLAMGMQLVRAVGVKRLVPILAVGGVALGLLAARASANPSEEPAE